MNYVTAILLNSLNAFQLIDQQSHSDLTSRIIFYDLPAKNVIRSPSIQLKAKN